jgi:hypothetical protein
MSKPIEALAEEYLLQLENNEAFEKIIVKPYTAYAQGALRRALAEAAKPAGPIKAEDADDPSKVRNFQIISDCLREHAIYNEIASLVSGQLAAIRQSRAAKEAKQKAGPGGQKDLQAGEEPA